MYAQTACEPLAVGLGWSFEASLLLEADPNISYIGASLSEPHINELYDAGCYGVSYSTAVNEALKC